MFYDVVVNDWGETTYVPTTLGNLCLIILIAALLGVAMFFIRKNSHRKSRKLTIKQSTGLDTIRWRWALSASPLRCMSRFPEPFWRFD